MVLYLFGDDTGYEYRLVVSFSEKSSLFVLGTAIHIWLLPLCGAVLCQIIFHNEEFDILLDWRTDHPQRLLVSGLSQVFDSDVFLAALHPTPNLVYDLPHPWRCYILTVFIHRKEILQPLCSFSSCFVAPFPYRR